MSKSNALTHWVARTTKAVLPRSLHPLVSRAYMRTKARAQTTRDWLSLSLYRLTGRTYHKWYADRLDGFATVMDLDDKTVQWIRTTGYVDLDALKSVGMKPHHTLHEFGVGFMRSAHWFIDYLDAGNFSGNDASMERIRVGTEVVGRSKIEAKRPLLLATKDNSFDWLPGRKVDYFWSHAVFAHMPAADIEETIKNLRKIMHAQTKCLVVYDEPDRDLPGWRETVKDWTFPFEWYREVAVRHGYDIILLDFVPPAGWDRRERMFQLTLAGK